MSVSKNQVLIVDDDRDMLEIMAQVLSDDYDVAQALNGEEALKVLSSCEPSALPGLIILDTIMPVMDGNEFLNRVRIEFPDSFARIPVLLSSANGHANIAGFAPMDVRLLTKPMNIDQLMTAVDHAFRA